MSIVANQSDIVTACDGDPEESEIPTLTSLSVPTAYESALIAISGAIANVGPGCSIDQFDMAQGMVQTLGRLYKSAKLAFDNNAILKIDQDGDVVIGETRYYVGVTKSKKPANPAEMLDQMFQAAGGDMAQVANCLSSNAIKVGEAGKLLGPAKLASLITVEESKKLKDGKPIRGIKAFNPKFVR